VVAGAGAMLALVLLAAGLARLDALPAAALAAIRPIALPVPEAPAAARVMPAAVDATAPLPGVAAGIGGPEEPLPGTAGGGPDLVAGAARATVMARNLQPDDLSRPVLRPVEGGWISSGFGRRKDPFTGRPALHTGVDFAGLPNSAVVAAGAGVVTRAGRHRGYGNLIEVDHGNGYVSRYGHNASNLVAPGEYVKAGQVIALMGSTGRSTGSHLHFEVLQDGHPVNPVRLIARR
jgi:murein DD-endopeptidase MepM/ murein hydrolase activator NlpD